VARIRADLFAKIMQKGRIEQAQAYRRISDKSTELVVGRDLAALAVAADLQIPIAKYATPDQLTDLRAAKTGRATHTAAAAPAATTVPRGSTRGRKTKPISRDQANTVFVVHGRDAKVNESMFQFLRALGLNPIEWNTAVGYTRDAAPHISKVLDAAFKRAAAAVIVFTPDDEVRLRPQFHTDDDEAHETEFRGQARPNVLFEAGIALALRPGKTVLVEVGKVRPFTDISGMHTVRLTGSATSRHGLVTKLKNAGCHPDTRGAAWLTVGEFAPREVVDAAKSTKRKKAK
jgi:predicted nucleotide-binding protein